MFTPLAHACAGVYSCSVYSCICSKHAAYTAVYVIQLYTLRLYTPAQACARGINSCLQSCSFYNACIHLYCYR